MHLPRRQQHCGEEVELKQLYGSLHPAEQERALVWQPDMPRRVIVATSIAETSLSVPGVRCVVDFGLTREPARKDMMGNILQTVRVKPPCCACCQPLHWLRHSPCRVPLFCRLVQHAICVTFRHGVSWLTANFCPSL